MNCVPCDGCKESRSRSRPSCSLQSAALPLRPLALLESDEPDWPTRRKVNAASSLSGRKLFVRSFGQTVLIDLADITLLALSPQDAILPVFLTTAYCGSLVSSADWLIAVRSYFAGSRGMSSFSSLYCSLAQASKASPSSRSACSALARWALSPSAERLRLSRLEAVALA